MLGMEWRLKLAVPKPEHKPSTPEGRLWGALPSKPID